MVKKLLFFCELSTGHFAVALTLAKTILKYNKDQYEIWFLVNKEYQKIVSKKIDNVRFLLYSFKPESEDDENDVTREIINFFGKFGEKWAEKDRIKFILNGGHSYLECFKDAQKNHAKITELIKGLKPDLILIDSLMTIPTGINLGIPYVTILSAAPTFFGHYQLPPPRSGLSGDYTEENVKIWNKFIEDAYHHPDFIKFMNKANDWLKKENAPVNFDGKYIYYAPSPYLNVYNYPAELDYTTDIVKMPGNWVRMDSAVIDIPSAFPIPEKLKNLPGKLIYFSLGSMASCYRPLMNRLLKVFGQMNHKFIISTGLIGDQYELSANQYGEKFLNQSAVLQIVDIFISHCGNNSFTEACHFGVPLICTPLFADQIDNAQRVHEKGYGISLHPFYATKKDFEKAIEFCSNEQVKRRYQKMSERIKKDNNLKSVCESILELVK